jgi:hypothetical protein
MTLTDAPREFNDVSAWPDTRRPLQHRLGEGKLASCCGYR